VTRTRTRLSALALAAITFVALWFVTLWLIIITQAEARRPMIDRSARLSALLTRCKSDPARFAWSVLGRDGDRAYWPRQLEICRSVAECRTTVVPAGNGVGKSYVGSGIFLWFLFTHRDSIVFTSGPSQDQLESVLWKEIRSAHAGSRVPLGGKVSGSSPITLELGDRWFGYGHVSNKVERMSGKHKRDLLAIVDEASGASQVVYDALDSLNPSRILLIGNPLRPDGKFYDLCRQADEVSCDPALLRKIVVPSTESPHADLERSPHGMADRTWLAAMASEYGEESLWWLSHVMAMFPGDADDALVKRAWLDLAGRMLHVPSGPRRISIDLGLGKGNGDESVLICRDDNGVLAVEHSRRWTLEDAATRCKRMAETFGVEARHISYDHNGIGADFANRLAAVGLHGCRAYIGGMGGPSVKFHNLRSAAAWTAARRLDPDRMLGPADGHAVMVRQHPFAIRPEHLALLRPDVEPHRYKLDNMGRIQLEEGEIIRARLRRSPDFADAFFQSFAFPG